MSYTFFIQYISDNYNFHPRIFRSGPAARCRYSRNDCPRHRRRNRTRGPPRDHLQTHQQLQNGLSTSQCRRYVKTSSKIMEKNPLKILEILLFWVSEEEYTMYCNVVVVVVHFVSTLLLLYGALKVEKR